ncbi:uncharacterized protein LOC129318764 [Prosopis cineraria]|uniref:uncharacterized protein LOC129318764 n=1 Tax=Prosopis cineraria TaxID=364024 RepID=UPI00240F95C0|nr:uncharacterized protein LOC129318764 [Prosopis cineraria]XP_054819674.1 uncharacterized protein LOC129318764 [Prosopis cineraria]
MGLCLKGKGLDEMNVVLHRLRHSKPINMDEGVRDAFSCLKLSYDYLRMPEAKLLFLVCAIFPEDHKIIIEDILRYGVGLGLCRDADSFEVARSQVRVALNILVDSSLLTYSQNVWKQECLTMHDMVRDVALWIASKEDCTIMVNCAKELDELLGDEAVKDCYAVSSWHEDKKLCQFPSQLDAPKLEILLLNSTKPLDLSLASFEGLEEIKVVAMVHDGPLPQKELRPQSMQWLSNLQTLRLQKWDLGDISFVVRLRKLEILDLCGSKFKKLPSGIENLNQLKLLDLSMCEAEECCCEVIGRCSQIEELYASRNFLHMGNTNCYECLVDIPAVPKLRRYILEMGQCKCPKIWTKGRRVLYLGQLNIFISSALIRGLGQKATAIEFYDLQEGCKSFIPDVVQAIGGMNELTKLHLNSCSEIEWLINETTTHEDVVVPRLAELELVHMDNLRQLCHGPSYLNLFQNLESLNIDNCPQLLNMFPADCNLGNLKKLRISSCPMLILFHVSVACTLLSLRELSIHSCLQLHNMFPAHCNLDNLKFLQIFNCPMLTSLFPVSVACSLLSLEELRIEKCRKLKSVIEGEGGNNDWENPRFPKWEILSVTDCYQLESVCPISCAQGFVQLKHLIIKDALLLKVIFGEEQSIYDQNGTQVMLPLLENLMLKDLPNLLRICSKGHHPMWPSIKKVDWINCPGLNIPRDSLIIGSELRQPQPNRELHALGGHQLRNEEPEPLAAVSNIESINLWNCRVVSLFYYHSGVEVPKTTTSNGLNLIQQIPIFQCLKKLSVNNCEKLKSLFSASTYQSLPELAFVTISNCWELEEIFVENEQIQKKLSKAHSCLPKLQSLSISRCNKLRIIFSAVICQSLPELTFVTISDCVELEEIFGENEQIQKKLSKAHSCLPKLQSLSISKCYKLRRIFSAGICQSLPELTHVYIWQCKALEEIFTRNEETQKNLSIIQAFLPKLRTLEICNCNKLKIIFSVMTRCSNIEDHDIDSEKEIMFPNLKHIALYKLPRLVNVCQGFKLHIVEFCKVLVHECPKFVPFIGASIGWNHEGLVRTFVLKCSQLSNNTTLSIPVSIFNSEELDIESSRVLDLYKVIGGGDDYNEPREGREMLRYEHQMLKGLVPTQVLSFQCLHSLMVIGCQKLKFLFSTSTILHNSLPKLTFLTLSGCDDLEELIGDNDEPQNMSNVQLCFPKLRELEVKRCSKLKRLFPSIEIALPKLRILVLEGLPAIIDICGSFPFQLQTQSLLFFKVEDCPIFSKTTHAALNNLLLEGNPDEYQEGEETHDHDGFRFSYYDVDEYHFLMEQWP